MTSTLLADNIHLIFESSKAAFSAIKAYALRSALTTLGIIIGVAAVIAVIAIMQGLGGSISQQLEDFDSDTITLSATTSVNDQLLGSSNTLHYDDFLLLKERVKEVEHMTATASFPSEVQYGQSSAQTLLYATDSSYKDLVSVYAEAGRLPTVVDDERRRRVAFIGASLVKKLKLPESPVGEFVNVSGDWFRIIGVAESRGLLFGIDQDNFIVTPFSSIRALVGEEAVEDVEILFRPRPRADIDAVQETMRKLLRMRMELEDSEPDTYG